MIHEEGTLRNEENPCSEVSSTNTIKCVHAEAAAITVAPKELMVGATLYLVCWDVQTGLVIPDTAPCMMCVRLIVKVGIAKIINRISHTDYSTILLK